MLSIGPFNALLKTLEEPPSHVVFILATAEPHKLRLLFCPGASALILREFLIRCW